MKNKAPGTIHISTGPPHHRDADEEHAAVSPSCGFVQRDEHCALKIAVVTANSGNSTLFVDTVDCRELAGFMARESIFGSLTCTKFIQPCFVEVSSEVIEVITAKNTVIHGEIVSFIGVILYRIAAYRGYERDNSIHVTRNCKKERRDGDSRVELGDIM
ncbi:hypothetical protein CISG_05015 [Coccidioides immitis RMSCC 3703]|uniref:Uncharacterized protein n=1 Tax=Coccidioides immitis RMSCC 3703 TaxID=454286 RepID=A0A0J8TPH8_COCIT|nr:hypothetical protein CISG_05015 [Coccidioides immitis RMSCC 3703]